PPAVAQRVPQRQRRLRRGHRQHPAGRRPRPGGGPAGGPGPGRCRPDRRRPRPGGTGAGRVASPMSESGPPTGPGEPGRRRIHRSIIYKVVGVLIVTLVVSSIVTAVIASRLTSNALDDQTD